MGSDAAPPGPKGRRALFGHRPGLDGLRGVAVVAVLAFHGGFGWAEGGYLGVSAFFTLSGFLIATLLLREHDVDGRIDLRGFWGRRIRRLAPAGLIGLVLAVGYAAMWSESTEGLRGDVLSCLAYVANWRFVWSERSYADLFADPSPVQHYWSLAAEEQFYVLFPLLVAGCTLATRRVRRALLAVVVASIVASVAVSVLLADAAQGTDRVYYGTDARAAEILLGVVAAIAVARTSARRRPPAATRRLTGAGIAGLTAMAVMWVSVDQSDDALHPWLLLVHAAAAVAVIVAATRPGPVATALSWGPLRAVGKVSYGLYVYHWPVFLALSETRTGWGPGPLFAVRVAVTATLAAASYVLVERPILNGTFLARLPRRRLALTASGAALTAAVIVAAFVVPVDRTAAIDLDAAVAALDSDRVPGGETDGGDQDPVSIAVFGDSVALMAAYGIDSWLQTDNPVPGVRIESTTVEFGCPLMTEGSYRYERMHPIPSRCDRMTAWPTTTPTVDVAVVHVGTWDVVERSLPGSDVTVQIGHPEVDERLGRRMQETNDLLLRRADRVVWLTLPVPAPFAVSYDSGAAARVERFNALLRHAADASRGAVQIVDLADWVASYGPDDRVLRPDGVHFSNESSLQAGRWLGPAVLYAVANPDDIDIDTGDVPLAG